jgi:hypothetical protein
METQDSKGAVRGASAPLPGSEGAAGMPVTPTGPGGALRGAEGVSGDGLAKLLAIRFGVPPVEGEGGWARLTSEQQGYWEADADMVRGYLVHGLGWKAP